MAPRERKGSRPAEVFPPGEFIRDELDARGWTQQEFAEILGRPPGPVNQIINGKKEITPDTAVAVAAAFGTSPEVWLNLESAYRLSLVDAPKPNVRRRAHLRSLLPVRELQKRGWLTRTDSLDELEAAVCSFLEIESVTEKPKLPVAARQSGGYGELSASQTAWVFRAKHEAADMSVPAFQREKFEEMAPTLPRLSVDAAEMSRVVPSLSEVGVRVVFVRHLPGTRIDGAAFWLEARAPVVALSLRYDRIDSFWFTLMHELAHVHQGHGSGGRLDCDLVGQAAEGAQGKPKVERDADRLASDWLIPPDRLREFTRSTAPWYYSAKVKAFAASVGVHPGVVVGRLQHMGEIPWQNLRRMLTKASDLLTEGG